MHLKLPITKGLLFYIIVMLTVFSNTYAFGAQICGGETAVPLYTSNGKQLGTLSVSNDENSIFVNYSAISGWSLGETNLDVETSVDQIPQTKSGRAKLGKYKYRAEDLAAPTYLITIDRIKNGYGSGTPLYLSANAELVHAGKGDDDSDWSDDDASVWASGTPLKACPKRDCTKATYFIYVPKACVAHFSPGTDTALTSKTIDAYGGVLQIQNTGTPLDGVTVSVPPGALDRTTTFSVGYNTGTLSVPDGTPSGTVLLIDAGAVKTFAQPVTITVPFFGDNTVIPVPYYIAPDGSLKLAQLVNVDRTAHTLIFQTFHASWYTWIFGNVPMLATAFYTDHTPPNDGFQIVNYGSDYNREGECIGMTSFSQWYYENHKSTSGDFYPKYYNVIGTDSLGRQVRGQNIIATRAFISISQIWRGYLQFVQSQERLSDADKFASIQHALLATHNPVVLDLYRNDSTNQHSVLAEGFDSSNGRDATIKIYDPNYPGDITRTISYNVDTGFSSYGGYTGIVYVGPGSFNLADPYQNILDNANVNFLNSINATINVTSPTNGQEVQTRNVNLSGIITSSQVLVTQLTVFVGSTSYSGSVDNNGAFNIPIELNLGVNHILFVTEGKDSNGNLTIIVPNNLWTTDFTLNANVPQTVVLMTLTWDTNDTDLDTYVIDPTGDYSSYYHKVTQDGGTLDHDVTTGFGPEHWTLLSTNTIRYNQPYNFRVHYYSDHGHGPSNYTVTIELYEGTSRDITYTYRGNLAVSNPYNSAPNGQGPDWADIASITLTQPTALAPLLAAPQVTSSSSGIVITAPVPPPDQRLK